MTASTRSPLRKVYWSENGVRRQPVGQQVAEQELAEPASRLRRAQQLLELSQVLRLLGQLRGRAADVAELLVDRVRLLGGVLHPPVDLRVEVGQPPVDRLGQPLEAPLHLGVPPLQLSGAVRAKRASARASQTARPARTSTRTSSAAAMSMAAKRY